MIIIDLEEINKSVEAIGMDAIVQAERLQTIKTIVQGKNKNKGIKLRVG